MATILKITDSNGSINLMDNTNYRLRRGWTPKIAGRRRGPWAAGCPYEDVAESILIDILGSSAANCLSNLEALMNKLDLAERWVDGEATSGGAVYLEYKPNGSGLTNTPQSLILGRAPDADGGAMLNLSPEFNEVGSRWEILNVTLNFWRQGWFVEPAAGEESKQTATTTEPAVFTVTFDDDALAFSPLRIWWDTMEEVYTSFLGRGYIAVTTDSNYIRYLEGESADAFTGTQADTADTFGAKGGNVNRLTTSAGVSTFRFIWSASGLTLGSTDQAVGAAGEVALIMACRNRNTVNSWTAQATVTTSGNKATVLESVIVPPSGDTNYHPQYIHLGTVSTEGSNLSIVDVTVKSPVEDGSTFDVDYVAIVGLPNEAARVIALTEETDWPGGGGGYLIIDHKLMSRRVPFVGRSSDGSAIETYLSHRGDPMLVTGGSPGTTARKVSAAIFVHTNKYYGLQKAVGGVAPIQHKFYAKRRKAYLVPK